MSKKVRIGFIGAGGIAGMHMSYLKNIDGVEIAAAADVSQAALDKAKEQFGVEKLFTDWRKLLKLGDLDAVSICTPNKLHCQPTVAALEAGKHVLVEKPLAMNAREGEKMVQAAKKAKRVLQIGFQWRFNATAQMLRDYARQGKFGKILHVRCQAMRRRGIPSWGVFGRKDLQGGGPMIDIGVHIMEMAHYIMGSPRPISASGACHTYIGNKKSTTVSKWGPWDHKTYTVEDLAIGFVRFDDGSSLQIESSFAAHIEKDVHSIQIMGTEGGATYDPLKIFCDDGGYMVNLEPAFIANRDGFDYKMRHFVDCVRGDKTCEAPGEDGLLIQKIIDAVYKSAELQKEVAIK